jgi:hypothetical protein
MATARKTTATRSRTAARKTAPTKDPKGGLTAAGRAAFARKDGSHLKPGVRKTLAEMSPEEMKRKGSWAVRFYGRSELPPLVDAKGRPTRLALTAAAWGEPVPKTEAAARRIAAKGERLLERYRKEKEKEKDKAKAAGARKAPAAKTARPAAKKAPVRRAARASRS